MIRKVLQALAEENFDDKHYPVLHGSSKVVKPFVLMVKKQRPFYKRPPTKKEFKIIAELEKYVKDDKRDAFSNLMNSKKQTQDDLGIDDYDEKDEEAQSYVGVGLKAANMVQGSVKISCTLGELELGKLDEEYFDDPDLESILQETELDTGKMTRLENEELRLIYSVIYSGKFELKGKRKQEISVDGGVNVPISIIPPLKAKLAGHFKKGSIPPKPVSRSTRSPVYFKCARVEYDKEQGRLKLAKGEIVGKTVHRAVGDEDNEEYNETTLSFEDEDNLEESLTDEDFNKLEIIKKAVLMSAEGREKRKERIKKYLNWFKEALTEGKKTITLPDGKPLTDEDCDFLQNFFCPAVQHQSVVDLSSLDQDKIQGYAIVLKLIDDLSDDQWDEIEKAWAEP